MFAGVDSHKDTLALAVIDDGGRPILTAQIANQSTGFTELAALAQEHHVVRLGIEGSTNFGWAAAMHLAEPGVTVVEVPPLMTSRERMSRPGQGKTDLVDAVAIARITAREDDLPAVRPMDGLPADLWVLMDYREQLITQRTAIANRVHTDLGWLHPSYQLQLPRLTNPAHLRAALALLHSNAGVRAEITRSRLDRMLSITTEVAHPRTQITELVAQSKTTLLTIYGAGVLAAARILAEVVDVRRYPSRHHFAAANGSAPIPSAPGGPPATGSTAAGTDNSTRALHSRDHRDPRRHRSPRLVPAQTRRRQDRPRRIPLPEAAPL